MCGTGLGPIHPVLFGWLLIWGVLAFISIQYFGCEYKRHHKPSTMFLISLGIFVGCSLWPLHLLLVIIASGLYGAFRFSMYRSDRLVERLRNEESNNRVEKPARPNLESRPLALKVIIVDNESKSAYSLNSDSICSICIKSICCQPVKQDTKDSIVARPDDACVTTCKHIYHYHCLTEWFEKDSSCPECRSTQDISNCKVLLQQEIKKPIGLKEDIEMCDDGQKNKSARSARIKVLDETNKETKTQPTNLIDSTKKEIHGQEPYNGNKTTGNVLEAVGANHSTELKEIKKPIGLKEDIEMCDEGEKNKSARSARIKVLDETNKETKIQSTNLIDSTKKEINVQEPYNGNKTTGNVLEAVGANHGTELSINDAKVSSKVSLVLIPYRYKDLKVVYYHPKTDKDRRCIKYRNISTKKERLDLLSVTDLPKLTVIDEVDNGHGEIN